jgi:hypothetical protein
MPQTTIINDTEELTLVSFFNPEASYTLMKALKDGKKIEKIESTFKDVGDDYVTFNVDGTEICRIAGY